MQHAFLSDDEREESIIERRERERGENGKVDNDEPIPLLPNITKDARKTIVALQVWKTDPPNDGYKGSVPVHADVETIAKRFGNGIYEFHGVTQDAKVLRRAQNVKISWEPEDSDPPAETPQYAHHTITPADKLLDWQASQHAKDSERVESFARLSVETSHETAKQHILTLGETLRASQERDRAFFAGMMSNQQNFFAAMLQQTTLAHQQAMERSREDFRQSFQVMQLSHERATQSNDPRLLLGLFERGLALGQGLEGDEETEGVEPWAEAIKAGAGVINNMTEIAKMKAVGGLAVPKAIPAKAPSTPPPEKTEKAETAKRPAPFDKQETAELLRLKKIMDQKGLDFIETVRNASAYFVGGNDTNENAPASGNAESPDESGPESGDTDLE